jgi:hypothetical protein
MRARHLLVAWLGPLSALGCQGTLDDTNGSTSGGETGSGTGGDSSATSGGMLGAGTGSSLGGSTSAGGGAGGNATAQGGASTATGGAAGSGTGGGAVRHVCDDKTYGALAQGRRLTTAEYQGAITDVFKGKASEKYPASYGQSASGFSTEPGISQIGEQGVEQLMLAAEEVAEALPSQLATILPCSKAGDATCAGTFLDTVGRRAFRRALSADERSSLLAVYTAEAADGATFAEAVSVMTAQLLQMPAFLYVLEQPSKAGVDRALTGPELASRLSFHFWDSVPDDELLNAAETGKLTTKADVQAQGARLFKDARSDRGFVRFFREWTGTSPLTTTSKDVAAFPKFNAALVTSVNTSFEKFVVDQVRQQKTLYSVLRSNTGFVDATLAAFLGLPKVTAWTTVTLAEDRYSGIMTQPAMMAALSHSTDTSYQLRGKFVRKRLLCQPLGSPPANAMTAFAALEKPANPTGKELSAVVQSQPGCAGCHQMLDPAGLAFEHFDAMGVYREAYPSGKAIDTTGSVLAVTAAPIAFQQPVDLMESLAMLPQTQVCFSTQIFRYTASRVESGDESDACAIQKIGDAMTAADGQVDEAFLAATQTDAFLYRRGE